MLRDLAVPLPGQHVTTATPVAKQPGVLQFVCAIQAHRPIMRWLRAAALQSRVRRAND